MILNLTFSKLFFVSLLLPFSVASANLCTNPSVRREWSALSGTERAEWISAVKCLAKLPHDPALSPSVDPALSVIPPVNSSSSYYDDLVYVHMDLNIKIHWTGLFLPWHRAYMHAFESALKTKCGFHGTQPYWDWSRHTEHFFNSSIFDPSPTSGFGTNGDPNKDYQLTDGGFDSDFLVAYPVPHAVWRNFTVQPWQTLSPFFADGIQDPAYKPDKLVNTSFSKQEVDKLVNGFVGDFKGFQAYFEYFQGAHAGVHFALGGDLSSFCPSNAGPDCVPGAKWAPNDPIFFVHHTMIEKVWYDWQHKHESNFWSYHGGSVSPLANYSTYYEYPNGKPPYLHLDSPIPSDGMFEGYTIFDMMNTTGGPLCYVYA